jgi:EmrB/QacA subfamily drug resistance transporter
VTAGPARPSSTVTATRPGAVLAIVCAGVVLASLNMFLVSMALPRIAQAFRGTGLADLSWVLNAYTIVFAALLVPAGRLADRAGRTRGFLLGVVIFTGAAACAAAAGNVGVLVGFCALMGVGAALLIPTSLSLVLAAYPPERRGGAVRTWAAMGGLAAGLGPVIGGPLVGADWRWAFLINLPVGVLALAAGWRWLPDTPGDGGAVPDVTGALLLTVGMAALILGLVKSNDWGWGTARVIGLLAAAAAAGVLFVWRSARHPSPVLELRLLRIRGYSVTLASALLFSAAFAAMLLAFVLWVQNQWGWSALQAGLAMAPGPLMVPVLSVLAGPLIRTFGPGRVIAAGCAVYAAGALWWVTVVGLEPSYADLIGGLLLTGSGVGLALPTLFATATASLPAQRFATGSAVVAMIRQLGFAVGVAGLVAVLGTPATAQEGLDAFQRGWSTIAAVALLAAVTALLLRRPQPAPSIAAAPATAADAPAQSQGPSATGG